MNCKKNTKNVWSVELSSSFTTWNLRQWLKKSRVRVCMNVEAVQKVADFFGSELKFEELEMYWATEDSNFFSLLPFSYNTNWTHYWVASRFQPHSIHTPIESRTQRQIVWRTVRRSVRTDRMTDCPQHRVIAALKYRLSNVFTCDSHLTLPATTDMVQRMKTKYTKLSSPEVVQEGQLPGNATRTRLSLNLRRNVWVW